MGTTTKALRSKTLFQDGVTTFTQNKIWEILSYYETVWEKKPDMKSLYASRVNNVMKLYVRGIDKKGKGTYTNKGAKSIFVIANPATDGSNNWTEDKIFHGMSVNGEMGFTHNIVASILMEIGNCAETSGEIEGIRTRLYQGIITLREAGYQIAYHESAGMWDYIRLMRVIPASLRPHQSNRDLEANKAYDKKDTFGKHFAESAHSTQDPGGTTKLLSWETYAYESLSDTTRGNVIKLLDELGVILQVGGVKWPPVVQKLNNKFSTDKADNIPFYCAALELIEGYQSLYNVFSPWSDPWELSRGMEELATRKSITKSVTVTKIDFLSMCEAIAEGSPGAQKPLTPTKNIDSITNTNKYLKVSPF